MAQPEQLLMALFQSVSMEQIAILSRRPYRRLRAEPIPFDQQLQPQADFDSFARLEAAASQALAVGTNQRTPASALPFSAFPFGPGASAAANANFFSFIAHMESQGLRAHMAAQAPAPMAQPTFSVFFA
jgi:hypothetical protein